MPIQMISESSWFGTKGFYCWFEGLSELSITYSSRFMNQGRYSFYGMRDEVDTHFR